MTTWNPSDKNSNVTLSGGNLVATVTDGSGSGTSGGVRGTTSKTTGKVYFEGLWTRSDLNTSKIFWFGLAQSGADLSAAPLFTQTGYGAGVWSSGSSSVFFSSPDVSFPTSAASSFASGDYMGIAVDLNNALAWVSHNGTWLNFGAGDDPNTGIGGCAIDSGATWYPVCGHGSAASGNATLTVNFGGSAFAYSAPTGFSAWDAASTNIPAIMNYLRSQGLA